MIDDGVLDEVGFEEGRLQTYLGQVKDKHRGMSLMHLIEEVRDLAGLKPLLTRVWNKYMEIEIKMGRIADLQNSCLNEINLSHQWGIF